jgi:hypothetical protein
VAATDTDAPAEVPRGLSGLRERVVGVLLNLGFREHELHGLMVVAQLQAAVDRDCEGSWFYALR